MHQTVSECPIKGNPLIFYSP